ncbi:MAG: sulfotransferase [Acidimicrobiales bacterium]|nr:sulfotransferase [Acidimicrobiales bacterium]
MAPILLLASERSGTNLLRVMFDRHSDVSGPPAPHLLRTLTPLAAAYGDLTDDERARAVVRDVLELCRTNTGPWTRPHDEARIVASAHGRTIPGLVAATYAAEAAADGAHDWFCKENELWRFADELAEIPGARVIHLHRDGRDAALSYRKSGRVAHTWPRLADKWRAEQEACLDTMERLTGAVPTTTIAYEALTADPEGTLRAACAAIDLPFQDAMTAPEQSARAREDATRLEMWRNLDKPVNADNSEKWRHEAAEADVERFERRAGDMLLRLGYRPAFADGVRRPLRPLERVVDTTTYARERVRVMLRSDDAARDDRRAAMRRITKRAGASAGV